MDALETAARECRQVRRQGRRSSAATSAIDEDLQALVDRAIDRHGRIDVLVNNAGVVAGGRLDEIDAEDVERMTTVNIWAPIRLTQLALPHMRAAKCGTIVNVSSVAGPRRPAVLRDVLRQQVRDARLQRGAAPRAVAATASTSWRCTPARRRRT